VTTTRVVRRCYGGDGAIVPLQVAIPLPGNIIPGSACHAVDANNPPTVAPAAPTGTIANPSAAFLVPGTKIPAAFIFDTEDGTLSAWAGGLNPRTTPVLAADNSASGAVYKGMAFGVNVKGFFLFTTNFHAGTIDVFGPTGSNGLFTPRRPPTAVSRTRRSRPATRPSASRTSMAIFFVTYAKPEC